MSLEENYLEVRVLALERQLAWALRTIQENGKRHAASEQQVGMAYTQMGQVQAPVASVAVSLAVLTGALATGTPGSPASAGATLYVESGGAWGSGGAITVKNTYALSASIASGKQVWVNLVAGTYYLLTSEC